MESQGQPLPDCKSIVECFEDMPDPRVKRTRRHKLGDILAIGLCSTIAVGESFSDMVVFGRCRLDWLGTFLELPNGIPSRDTFNRVFSAIDPDAFLDCFVRWVRGICPALGDDTVAIDGKALRRALDDGATIPYIVSAWASQNGLVLGQVKVDEKSNEITAVPELLDALDLDGCTVTLDAMGCQKEIAANIIDKHAEYVLALKGNQGNAHAEVGEFFADAVLPCATRCADTADHKAMDFHQTLEKDHGRVETRRYWQSTDIAWFQDKGLWKNLRSIGMVEAIRTVKGKSSIERRYYLSSLPLDAKRFAKAVRGHWGVENSLHWCLDVIFREDDSRAHAGNAAQNLATLRRIALNLVKKNPAQKVSQRQKRQLAAFDTTFLEQLLGI